MALIPSFVNWGWVYTLDVFSFRYLGKHGDGSPQRFGALRIRQMAGSGISHEQGGVKCIPDLTPSVLLDVLSFFHDGLNFNCDVEQRYIV